MNEDFAVMRSKMVDQQLARRGIQSRAVLEAMGRVPREEFVDAASQPYAYNDYPLTIGADQTISQPYIVAYMTEALELTGGETVLEIGTGSGYAAAVLAEIAGQVYTVERIQSLAESARRVLEKLEYGNVHVKIDDGTLGWPEKGPFDAIVVTASGPDVPPSLKQQLKIGGRLVIPVGKTPDHQNLIRVSRVSETEYEEQYLVPVRFVPLIGEQGWSS